MELASQVNYSKNEYNLLMQVIRNLFDVHSPRDSPEAQES